MSVKGKEYQMAVRIAGVVDKSFSKSLGTANYQLGSFKKTIAALDKDFSELDKGFDSIMNIGQECFHTIATAAGVAATAITAATAASIAVGSEFESAFAGVKKTVTATDKEYATLRQDIIEMTRDIPSSAAEIAGVMEIAGQLGIATESLTDFTETMINLGISTNMSAEESATALAQFANIVNMADYDSFGISNYERLGSVVVDLGNNFATTEKDIVTMATNIAATGDLIGLSESQIMALAATMSSTGIEAEKGGSAMSKLLRKIQLAVEENGNSLNKYAAIANMTGEEFTQTFEGDAIVALSAFIEGLNDTERNGMSAIAVLDDMGLSEIRLSDVILRLANSQNLMSRTISVANDAFEENTALAIEAGQRYETFESQVGLMNNAFTELGIAAYDSLTRTPAVKIIGEITDEVNKFTDNGLPKWINKINTSLPTIERKAKNAWKSVSPIFNGTLSFGKWAIENGDYLLSILAGIGGAMAAYKVASSATHFINTIMSLTSLNPVSLAILGVCAALGTLAAAVSAYKVYQQNLVDDNLAQHFGNIALSMEELQKVAQEIIGADSLGQITEAMDAFDKADQMADSISGLVSELNKENWKISIGLELTEDGQENYKGIITDYVEQMQEYVIQEQYAIGMNLSVGMGENGTDIVGKVSQFYSDAYDEMVGLGEELSEAVNQAFSDKILDPDEIEEIAGIQAKMANIQASLATSELDAQMLKLGMKYSGSSLDAESFQNLISEISSQLESAEDVYLESYAKNLSALENTYNGGGITYGEYATGKEALEMEYLNNMTSAYASASSFVGDTISELYGEEINAAIENALENGLDYQWDGDWDYSMSGLLRTLEFDKDIWNSMDAIEQLMNIAEPITSGADKFAGQFEAVGGKVSQETINSLQNVKMWEGLTEMNEDAYIAIGRQITKGNYKESYEAIFAKGEEIGAYFPAGIYTGMQLSEAELASAIQSNVNMLKSSAGKWSTGEKNKKSTFYSGIYANANGGIWDSPILTTFAENGMEAAIPIDGSQNAINLWEQTGRLLGMDSILDRYDISGSQETIKIEYKPTLKFYGEAPDKDDISDALRLSQDEFDSMMERYLKTRGRMSFGR